MQSYEKKQIVDLARQFLLGYSFDFNMFNEPTSPAPHELAMGLSVRSILLLEQNSVTKSKAMIDEQNKFHWLYRQAFSRRRVWNSIFGK